MIIGMVVTGMKRRSMSQTELSKLSGFSPPYISQLLSGARPGKWDVWEQLLDIVQSDYNDLGTFDPPVRTHVKRYKREPRSEHKQPTTEGLDTSASQVDTLAEQAAAEAFDNI
jgi:transcriptional regulator with XRE-family HTH domain